MCHFSFWSMLFIFAIHRGTERKRSGGWRWGADYCKVCLKWSVAEAFTFGSRLICWRRLLCFRSQLCLSALLCFLWSPAKTPPMLHPRFKNAPLLRPEKAHLVLRAAPRPLLATPPRRELGLPKCFCSCSLSWSYGEGDGEREGGGIST